SLTTTGASLGTPLYMAPEQLRSARDVDRRADVWALGVILYETLTGRPPFTGTSVTDLAIAIATELPATPRSLRPELPEALEAIILRCLEKRRESRFATVEALTAALEPFAMEAPPATPRQTELQRDVARTPSNPDAFASTHLATPTPG